MKKHLSFAFITSMILVALFRIGVGQENSYLAQKLMLENDLRTRIGAALDKILDDHRYVLDVTVDLKFSPTVREEVTFQPAEGAELVKEKPAKAPEVKAPAEVEAEEKARRRSRMTGIPIPGFDFQIEEEPEAQEAPEAEEEKGEEAIEAKPAAKKGAQIVSQSYVDITSSIPVIEKMEISCILPEGSSPELIENVRQIIMVASHFDRNRGDVLGIMTASFKERREEQTAEAIILRSIAEKIDQLEEKQKGQTEVAEQGGEEVDWRKELAQWREEEAKRREEEKALWRAELEKLENERLRRNFERQKAEILQRDSLKLVALTNEIDQLKGALSSATLSGEEAKATEEEVAAKEQEKAELDALIEEKLAMLQDSQEEVKQLESGMNNLPVYLMSAISLLAVVALAAVIIFNGRRPRYVVPPPWMMRRPPVKKKAPRKGKEERLEREEGEAGPAPAPAPPPPTVTAPPQPEEDPSVLQSEIKSVRQSIVSMSVGQPETATKIVKEWLEEEAPAPPAAEKAQVAAPPEAPSEEEKEGKKKKKKKKK